MITKRMNGHLTAEERETLLRFDYLDQCWYVETSVPTHITKFKKQGWEIVSQTLSKDGSIQAVEFKCDNPSSITIGKAKKREIQITEEHRESLRQRMKEMRKKS